MIQLRNVHIDDLPQLIAIENAGFTPEEAATKEAFIERIHLISDTFIVAEKEGEIVGFINGPVMKQLYITDDLFEKIVKNPVTGGVQSILGLAVSPHARKQGIAQQLLEELEKISKQAQRKALSLTCKEHLIEFYEQFGYVNHGLSSSTHGGVAWYNLVKEF